MMSNNSQLKNFLQQSFDNHEVVNNDGWEKINRRLSFQNYFKFGIKHVNIYNTTLSIGLMFFLYISIFANILNPTLNTANKIAVTPVQNQQDITTKKSFKTNSNNYIAVSKKAILPQKALFQSFISEKEHFSNDINTATESKTIVPEITDNENATKTSMLEKLQSKNEELNQKTTGLLATIRAKHSAPSNDQLKKYERPQWAVDLFTIPVFSDAMAINNNSQYETVKQKVAAGFALKCIYKKYLLETGFVYRSQSKDFSQTTYENSWTTYTVTDTKEIYNTNLITGKSYKASVDTVTRTEKKLNTIKNNVSAINTYTTMEIPVYVGYRFKYRKFASTSKIGLIAYINKTAVGKTVKSNDGSIEELSNMPITSANYMFSMSNSFCYKLRGPVNIFAEPYLKASLNDPEYHDLSIGSNKFTYGLKMGIEIVL